MGHEGMGIDSDDLSQLAVRQPLLRSSDKMNDGVLQSAVFGEEDPSVLPQALLAELRYGRKCIVPAVFIVTGVHVPLLQSSTHGSWRTV